MESATQVLNLSHKKMISRAYHCLFDFILVTKSWRSNKLSNTQHKLGFHKIKSLRKRCLDPEYARKMIVAIDAVRVRGDSVGGVVTCIVRNLPEYFIITRGLSACISLDIECFSYELAGSGYVFIPNRTNRLLSYLLNGTGYMNCLVIKPFNVPVNPVGL
ncbi:chorismate synthase protein [Artemisia annua]|uniref:chorismate synthase n=1 Tax=Artemisia annua TaxID=35608 RepID=A0A2U1P9A0_ARTAN|nr:chorismate synthase protein [Artemisia annua]